MPYSCDGEGWGSSAGLLQLYGHSIETVIIRTRLWGILWYDSPEAKQSRKYTETDQIATI